MIGRYLLRPCCQSTQKGQEKAGVGKAVHTPETGSSLGRRSGVRMLVRESSAFVIFLLHFKDCDSKE